MQLAINFDRPIQPRDPHIDPRDVPRVSRQCRLILERLRVGPATNAELVGIAMNLTGRISDLRGAGYVIVGKRIEGGLWEYRLGDVQEKGNSCFTSSCPGCILERQQM